MGAGVAAVAGIENEPSSCCAAIEEAQAELREELAGRNERQRELEFLEKGGDPLAFKSGETPSGLWSLSPTNPFAKQLLPSDGKGSCPLSNRSKEDDVEYSPEDGSEFKRARSITGKFYFVDRGATTISIESTPPDALPTSISSSIQHDRKDAPKKEFDICKSNKAAVKGQYARRNRQRTNRFGNGCVAFRDTGKVGSSNYSSGVRGSLTYDAEPKDVVKEQLTEVTADQDALQSRETDVVACVREGQEKAGATNDHPDYDTAVQVCQPLLLETTHNTDASDLEEQDEDPRSMNQLPSSLPSSLQYNVEEGRNLPSSLPCNPEEGRNLPLSLPCDTEAKNSVTVELSRGLFAVSGTEEGKQSSDESAKSNLDPESMNKPCSGGIPEVNQVAEYEGIPNKANQVDKVSINDHISLPGHLSTFDVTRTRTASECRQRLDNKMNLMAVKSNNSTLEFTSGSHVLEDKVQGIAPSSLDNKSSNNGLFGKAQRLEEVKVKVEDEMPADAVRSPSVARVSLSNERPVNPSMPQEPITLPPQYLEGGNMSSGHDVAEGLQVRVSGANGLPTADKLSGVALPREKMDLRTLGDGTSDIETNLSAAKKADKNSTAQEAEGIKQDSLRQSADWAKRRDFQEPPPKKSHWDFVLEEMAWLANDFMQERLWKIAAAAQVARWVAKEKWQLEFEETELCNRQCKIARSLAKSVAKFWHSIEGFLLRDAVRADSTTVPSLSSTKTDPGADDEAHKAEAETVKPRVDKSKALPIQAYAIRFVENSLGWQPVAQAEAPPTPDRIAESGMSDFWEEQFPEESLFYTVPKHAMEVYRQSVVSEWEVEYEQRLQEHESILAETEVHVAGETTEYSAGIYAVGPLVSPLVTGKRSSGFHGGSHTNVGSIPTKRMRTSAVAARQRAAGVTGPLVSGTAVHLTRSDISSCETNSQQDEMTNFLEGSSVSGRATDVDSNGAFARNNMAADGVDSPFKSKKKKKTRHFNGGHSASAACDMRESEQLWLHNFHRQSEQREHSKHKGEQLAQIGIGSSGLEGLGATAGSSHGAASVTSSASKLVKQMTNRDRGRKYKVGKASLSQPGLGIPWSPVEDQAILRLVYELGLNWELVSDILSSNSQLKGIFRKPKDCKERYKLLTDSRLGGDGGDMPDDPTSSTHLPISVTQKGGTRSLPQHLEETLRIHVDCILHLHQQLRSRKLQIESQEPKQLVPEHESHASKHTGLPGGALTPLELCELSSTTGESVSHAYPLQPAHGNGLGIPSMMSSGIGIRPNSAMSVLHGANNLQLSPSMSPSAAAATRDAQRLGSSMRPLTAEEHRLRHSRMVAGRGLQTQGLSVTSGLPLMGLSTATDCAAPPKLPSGNSAGLMSGLSRGMPLTRTGLPGMGPIGVPNISAGMNNVLPSVGMGLSGTGAVNPSAVSPPVSMMRRPREAMSMGHSQSATLNNPNSSLPNPVVSSPTQNLTAQQQQQLMQNNTLHAQQQGPGSSQQQAYNMMRVAKERQQLQQQHQKRMLQQQPGPTSNSSVSPFQSSQPLPVPQQQHVLSPHVHMYSQQHQPSHLLMQQHALQQEAGSQQQHAVGSIPSSNVQQSAQSPSGQPSLSGNSQNSQQQQLLSQAHQPTSSASSIQTPLQTKQHQNISMKQQQQQQQGKNIKGMGRGASTQGQSSILPNQLSPQLSGQQMVQGQRMVQSQGTVPSGGQQLAGAPQTAVQNLTVNLSQVPDAVVQQYQQKGFPQHLSGKHIPQQQPTSISTCPPIHPTSPPTGVSVPQQQLSPVTVASLPPTQQQRRAGQQSQTQQRRPQQPQSGSSISTQLASQSGKNGLQPSPVTCQLPVGFQLGSNMNSPLSMASPSGGIPLLSASTTGSGSVPSAQWKPGQSFSPMAAGLHNLSRSSGAAAQAPHLSMSMGMVMPLSNGNVPVTTNSLVTQEISRGGSQHASGHVGTLSQKPPVGSTATARAMPASQHLAPSQRQLAQQQLSCMPNSAGGSQVRTASSGTTPAPE